MTQRDALDPKGLVAEAYKIDGITERECRTIFLDWALSVPVDAEMRSLVTGLLERHAVPGHPMTGVLQESLTKSDRTGRRGGWRGRRKPEDLV